MMQLDPSSAIPIYMQIAAWIENEILRGNFLIDEKVHSQYTLAELFQINPATAAKGLTVLGQEGILYDKRGLGKFVSEEAVEKIKKKRKDHMIHGLLQNLIEEADMLGMDETEIIEMIQEMYRSKGE